MRGIAGRIIIMARPRLARLVRKKPFSGKWGLAGRLVRNGFFLRAIQEDDHVLIQNFMHDYWCSPRSEEFFDHFEHRFETVFLRHHHEIVGEIGKVVATYHDFSPRIVEVGTGDGRVLAYLESELENVGDYHGIDLNDQQIETNRKKFRRYPRFNFWTDNALHWLIRHPSPGTVLFTNGGVCEYMTREQLLELFTELARGSRPCAVAVTETLAVDHDLDHEPESFAYGHELSFSHNYAEILREAGFRICFRKDRPTEEGEEHHPARWCQFLAVADLPEAP